MIRLAIVLLAASLLGCGAHTPAPATAPVQAGMPECLADAIPTDLSVDPEWEAEYQECVQEPAPCERLCDADDAEACYSLALSEQARDHATAAEALFARACMLGHAVACTNYGAGLVSPRTEPSPEELTCGARIFTRTCEAGDDLWGCGMLGAALARGEGVAPDPARAENILARSCERVPYFACMILGVGYEQGWFGEVSSERAAAAYARACEGGYTDACPGE